MRRWIRSLRNVLVAVLYLFRPETRRSRKRRQPFTASLDHETAFFKVADEHVHADALYLRRMRNDIVGVDDVAARLRHLLAALAEDHSVARALGVRLLGREQRRYRTGTCARSGSTAGAESCAPCRRCTNRPATSIRALFEASSLSLCGSI